MAEVGPPTVRLCPICTGNPKIWPATGSNPRNRAQPPVTNPRIGFLSSFSSERDRKFFVGFQQGLRELGYWEGQNVFIEQRYAAGQAEKLPELAVELVRLKVNILVVAGAPAALAAKKVTSVIPTVFPNVADPVGIGLVDSLARPGGNITGLSSFNSSLATKRIDLLKEVVPSASRFAVLPNPTNPTNPPQLKLIRAAGLTLGVSLLSFEAQGVDEVERAFSTMRTQRPDALIVIDDPLLSSRDAHRRARRQEPVASDLRKWPMGGCGRSDVLRD